VGRVRVLLASTGGSGHVGPLLPVLSALVRRGDEVLLVVPPALAGTAGGTGQPYVLGEDPPQAELGPLWERFAVADPDEQAVLANRELFARLCTTAMLPTLEGAFARFRPDLVVREPCEYASAVVAEQRGVRHVQVAIGLAEVERASLELAAPVLRSFRPDLPERLLAAPYLTRLPAELDPSPFPTTLRVRDPAPPDRPRPLPDCMTLSLIEAPDIAGLPAAVSVRPASMDTVTPMRVALGLDGNHASSVVAQAQALVDAHPQSPVALARLAQAAQSVGDTELACETARAVLAVTPQGAGGSAGAALHAAAFVLAANDAPDAGAALARDLLPGAAAVRAGVAAREGDDARALAELTGNNGPLAESMRGWLLLDSNPGQAITALRAAARQGLRSPDVLTNLGYGLESLGATRKAIQVTREATVMAPTDLCAAYNLSVYLHRARRDAEALAELDRIASLLPDDPELALRRAWGHVHLANDRRAGIRYLKEARERFRWAAAPSHRADIGASIVYLEYRCGDRSLEAVKAALWSKLPLSRPADGVARMLGSLLGDPGDGPELQRLLNEAGDVFSPHLLLMQQARLAVLEDRLDDAANLATQAANLAPSDHEVTSHAVYIVGETVGEYARAADLGLRCQPPTAEPLLANNVAFALALAGRPTEADKVISLAGGADTLPFFGATAALVLLAVGRIEAGLAAYQQSVDRVANGGDPELASLIDWRRRLAMPQLGLALRDGEDTAEPPGSRHEASRVVLRRVRDRLGSAPVSPVQA